MSRTLVLLRARLLPQHSGSQIRSFRVRASGRLDSFDTGDLEVAFGWHRRKHQINAPIGLAQLIQDASTNKQPFSVSLVKSGAQLLVCGRRLGFANGVWRVLTAQFLGYVCMPCTSELFFLRQAVSQLN
jgi:hypothetical protein